MPECHAEYGIREVDEANAIFIVKYDKKLPLCSNTVFVN